MAGHSKWSNVKQLKGPLDQKRGQLFSKLAIENAVAAKPGGGGPDSNPRLRSAIPASRARSVSHNPIDRAIKRGSRERTDSSGLEEFVYEAYGAAGIEVNVEASTDNKNRVAQDLRNIFLRHDGNVASGSMSYMFKRKGQITVSCSMVDEDKLLETALDAGAEDMMNDGECRVVITSTGRLYAAAEAIRKGGIEPDAHKLTFIPDFTVHLSDEHVAAQVVRSAARTERTRTFKNVHARLSMTCC